MGTAGRSKGLSTPLALAACWQDTGLQQERLEGGTATALSYFPPPAEKFSQRLWRPQGSGRFLQGWGEERAGSAVLPHLLCL